MIGLFLRILVQALGIVCLTWCLIGRLLLPCRRAGWTVCFLSGRELGLEQQVRAFAFLHGSGLIRGQLLLVDCGMDARARIRAQALCVQYSFVELHSEASFDRWQQESRAWSRNPS